MRVQRTLRIRRMPADGGRPGEVVLATEFDDPEYGPVRCAAAELMAAHLGKAEPRIRWRIRNDPTTQNTFTAAYLDRRGIAGGFAITAHRDDTQAAERAADLWTGLLRSRRLLVADVPRLCWGGERALRSMRVAAAPATRTTIAIGTPAAPARTLSDLDRRGVRIADDLDQVPADARIVIPAHGATIATRAEAAARGLDVLDMTCPLVAATQADAAAEATSSDLVVVIADPHDAATRTVLDHAGEAAVVVSAPRDIHTLDAPGHATVSFVIEPGMSAERAMPVLSALRARFPRLRGQHFDVLCDAMSDREEALASVAIASDLALIISPDPHEACRIAERLPVASQIITTLADLDPEQIADATTIGIIDGLSATARLGREVITALSGLGPLTVRRRGIRTRGYPGPASAQRASSRLAAGFAE